MTLLYGLLIGALIITMLIAVGALSLELGVYWWRRLGVYWWRRRWWHQ